MRLDIDQIRAIRPRLSSTAATIKAVTAVSEAIREAHQVSAGQLYVTLCGVVSWGAFGAIVTTLENAGLVKERNHMLTWIGPEIPR